MVAYYFAPIGGIGSIRSTGFAWMLPELGWDTTVLAPRATAHEHDPHLRFDEERVLRVRSLELSRVARATLGAPAREAVAVQRRPLLRTLRSVVYRYAFFPDAQVGWYPAAVAAGLRALRRERFDVIFSSSNPMTSHLIARTLSRRAGIPWVAEYRDPWADRQYRGHPYRPLADALERSVARRATTIVMPTAGWAEHYGRTWGVDVEVLPNGAETDLPPRQAPAQPVLGHVGTYYPGEHDLTPVWRALARRRQQGAVVPRLRFIGTVPGELRAEIERYGLGDLLDSTGFVPHADAMQEMMSVSMLIASGTAGDDPAQRGWVPAKLFEYLASGLPVLYVSEPGTDAARLIDGRPGCHLVAPDDVDGAERALASGLADGDTPRDVGDLSREARARSLAEILERAVRR